MPIQYKIRRGTTSQANSLTLTEGEIYMDLGTKTLRVHDGVQQGGHILAKKSELDTKQNTLVSGTNIKTINGSSLLGSGNLTLVTDISGKVDKINITPGTVGSGSAIPIITYNAQGQITSVSTSALNIPSNIATETYVNTQIANLVDTAPSTLNTLNELAAALGDDPNFATTISSQLGLKANTSSLATVATSGSYNDLTNKPFIPNLTSQLMNDAGYLKSADFKTINGESIVGSGDIQVSSGSSGGLGGMISWHTSFNIQPTLPYSGVWMVPAGVTTIKVTLTGAGGGGGKSNNGTYTGGGSGGSIVAYVSVVPESMITWQRGVAGLGATTNNTAGTNGTESSITLEGESTPILRALGGIGGGTFFGGAGGQNLVSIGGAVKGHIAVIGQPGAAAGADSTTINQYGAATGAASIWGGGSQYYNVEGNITPRHGTGGAGGNGNAKPGGDGVVMIEW